MGGLLMCQGQIWSDRIALARVDLGIVILLKVRMSTEVSELKSLLFHSMSEKAATPVGHKVL